MIGIFGQGANETFGKIEFATGRGGFSGALCIRFDALQLIDNDQVASIRVAGEHAVFLATCPLLGEKNAIFLNPLVGGHAFLFHIGEPTQFVGLSVEDGEIDTLIFGGEPSEIASCG